MGCNNGPNGRKRKKESIENTETSHKNNNINEKIKKNETTNQNELINYYLICPECQERSPHIEKLYYDENTKEFLVKYTCICSDNTMHSKEIPFMQIVRNKEPTNKCNIHLENKLTYFCKTCRRAICNKCNEELHKGHNIDEENMNNKISKEDADNILKKIIEKEQELNEELDKNKQKIEKGIDNMIQKLNEEKNSYKIQIDNYKDNNKKAFSFLKNLYLRYINNLNELKINQDNNINNDIMLTNHIKNFSVINNDIPQLNSNVEEIINQYNGKKKELKLGYLYGFNTNKFSIEEKEKENFNNISKISNINNQNNNLNNNINIECRLGKKGFNCIKILRGHSEKVVSLIQLSSGKLISGSYDNSIRIWNLNNDEQELIINENGKVFCILEFEKDKILTGTSENCINLWDINYDDNTCIYSFIGHDYWVNALVKCNNNYFASGSNDCDIKIWDYYNKICKSTLKGHVDCILSLFLLKNNDLCSGSADLTLRIWDWENSECLSILKGHEKWVKCVIELDNGIILTGSDDKTIKLWENYINIGTLEGHTHSVRTFCQINNKFFASGSFDCTIKIWEINKWKCVQTLYGHESNIICLITLNSRISNNYIIASCSNDKTIKIWEGNP